MQNDVSQLVKDSISTVLTVLQETAFAVKGKELTALTQSLANLELLSIGLEKGEAKVLTNDTEEEIAELVEDGESPTDDTDAS